MSRTNAFRAGQGLLLSLLFSQQAVANVANSEGQSQHGRISRRHFVGVATAAATSLVTGCQAEKAKKPPKAAPKLRIEPSTPEEGTHKGSQARDHAHVAHDSAMFLYTLDPNRRSEANLPRFSGSRGAVLLDVRGHFVTVDTAINQQHVVVVQPRVGGVALGAEWIAHHSNSPLALGRMRVERVRSPKLQLDRLRLADVPNLDGSHPTEVNFSHDPLEFTAAFAKKMHEGWVEGNEGNIQFDAVAGLDIPSSSPASGIGVAAPGGQHSGVLVDRGRLAELLRDAQTRDVEYLSQLKGDQFSVAGDIWQHLNHRAQTGPDRQRPNLHLTSPATEKMESNRSARTGMFLGQGVYSKETGELLGIVRDYIHTEFHSANVNAPPIRAGLAWGGILSMIPAGEIDAFVGEHVDRNAAP